MTCSKLQNPWGPAHSSCAHEAITCRQARQVTESSMWFAESARSTVLPIMQQHAVTVCAVSSFQTDACLSFLTAVW